MVDRRLLVDELRNFALVLTTDYPVSDALHDFVDATTAIFDIRGAGVSLDRAGRLEFATASPADIAALEEFQESRQAGPSVEAFRTGTPVLVTDLASDPARWPELTAIAAEHEIVSLASFPLHLHGDRLGALDLYDARPHAWTEEEVECAELLAAHATGYLANASRLDRVRQTAAQLQEALDSRVVIEQAKGVLAGQHAIPVDQAFEVLRAYARRERLPLREVARMVVAGEGRPP